MSFNILEFSTQEQRDKAFIQSLISLMQNHIKQHDSVNLALSGGKSPIALFERLNTEEFAWDKCNISLVDERVVSTDSEDSNAKLIRQHLLKNKAASASFMPLLEHTDMHISKLVSLANANYKQPDFALLGMGADGHTASIFPNADEFEYAISTDDSIVSTTPKSAPYQRLSMSLHALEKCKRLFLLIAGNDKKLVLDSALKGINPLLPISYVLHSKKVDCDVYYS